MIDIYRLPIYYIDKRYIEYLYIKYVNVAKCMQMHGTKEREEQSMAVDRSLISGSMTMLILKLLSEKDMYGYEMIDTLRQKSENVFELKAGTLYPLLHGLEEKRLLTVYEKECTGKVRKYYSITREGKHLLKQKQEEWKEYQTAVTNVLAMEV